MIPRNAERYSEFVYTLTSDEQRVIEIQRSRLKRMEHERQSKQRKK